MDSLLYWFPGVKGVHAGNRKAVLEPLGLLHVLEGTSPACREVSNGPDGADGCVMVARNEHTQDARAMYVPKEQTWRKCAGGAFWVGFWNGERPGPKALCRREVVSGFTVELCDGQKWLVPLVRQISGETLLPRSIGFDENGSMVLDIQPKFREFYETGARVWDKLVDESRYADSMEQLVEIAIVAMGVNYHMGKWEIGALGLLDSRNAKEIVDVMVDGPTLRAWMEKKTDAVDGDGLNASDGSEAS